LFTAEVNLAVPIRPFARVGRATAVVTLVCIAGVLSACAPEPEPEPVRLTLSSAAAAYLSSVCPVNDAWDDLDFAVDQLRLTLDASGGVVDPNEAVAADAADAFARYDVALGAVREISLAAADSLENPDQVVRLAWCVLWRRVCAKTAPRPLGS
jgi:hypothetical protein